MNYLLQENVHSHEQTHISHVYLGQTPLTERLTWRSHVAKNSTNIVPLNLPYYKGGSWDPKDFS